MDENSTLLLWGILALAGFAGYFIVSKVIDWFSRDRSDKSKYFEMDAEGENDGTIGGWDPKKPIE